MRAHETATESETRLQKQKTGDHRIPFRGHCNNERIGAHLRLQQMTGRAPRLVDLSATIDVELISQCHSRSIRISLIPGFKYLRTEESRKSFSSLMPGQERNRYFGGFACGEGVSFNSSIA